MMYLINKKNYEQYILDYLEGNLNPGMTQAMEEFLERNPEVYKEIQDLMDYSLVEEVHSYEAKEGLKKPFVLPLRMVSGIAAAITILLLAGIAFIKMDRPTDASYQYADEVEVQEFKEKAVTGKKNKDDYDVAGEDVKVVEEGMQNETVKSDKKQEERVIAGFAASESQEHLLVKQAIEKEEAETFVEAEIYQIEEMDNTDKREDRQVERLSGVTMAAVGLSSGLTIEELPSSNVVVDVDSPSFLAGLNGRLDEINENILPYLKFAKAKGLISESYEIQPISLRVLADALVPESIQF